MAQGAAVLANWIRKLDTSPAMVRKISHALAEESVELIREGFETETDPYGKKWAPLKSRSGQILRDKGHLVGGMKVKYTGPSGWKVGPTVDYGHFHQEGTKSRKTKKQRIPQRMFVPRKNDIPAKWLKRLQTTAVDEMKRHYG